MAGGGGVLAEPAGAAALEAAEEGGRPAGNAEEGAGGEVVEVELGGGGVVGVVAFQHLLELFAGAAVEGNAADVAVEEDEALGREAVAELAQAAGVVFLPLVAVGGDAPVVLQAGVEVGHLVEHHGEEHIRAHVAVDADFVAFVVALRPAVVAQLGVPLAGDVEVHGMGVEDVVDAFHGPRGEVAREVEFILFG